MAKTPPDGADDDAASTQAPAERRHVPPPPSAQALRRAAPLFAQLMGLGEQPKTPGKQAAAGAQARLTENRATSAAVPARSYPLAAQRLAVATEASLAFPGAAEAVAQPTGDLVMASEPMPSSATAPRGAAQAPLRPQGFVRKSVPKSEWVPQVLLEDVAQMALFDGGTSPLAGSFVIVFREELLGELQCRIEIDAKGELAATFLAADSQTYALLQAHTSRLEAQLIGHGLRHVSLTVAQG